MVSMIEYPQLHHRSTYTKFHCPKTTLLAVHIYIVRAMSTQQLTCVCLLDLYATFDTIDRFILLERLSIWFGFSGTVLS